MERATPAPPADDPSIGGGRGPGGAPDDDPRWAHAFGVAFGGEPPTDAPLPKTLGRFEITGEIGRGGNGRVLSARDPILGREVAIKLLRADLHRRGDAAQRLVAEARVAAGLQHPGTVPLHELGFAADGSPYLVMQRVRGRTLAELLAARARPEVNRHALLGVFLALCKTLAYAHSLGIAHRDVKPANVMVGAFGEVQLVDWGLAKSRGPEVAGPTEAEPSPPGSPASPELTAAGTLLGTPRYMAPEQAAGGTGTTGARTDVFALGGVLAEILTGRPPYLGEAAGALADAAEARLEGLHAALAASGADPALIALALDCLQPDPQLRPADAGVVAARLDAHLAEVAERARTAELEAAALRERAAGERRRRLLGWSILAALACGAVSVAFVQRAREVERRERSEASARLVSDALLTAADRRAKAEAGLDPQVWEAAVLAAQQAQSAARAGSDGVDRTRVDAAVEAAEAGLARALDTRAQQERDREMFRRFGRLDAFDLAPGDDGSAIVDAELARLFTEYGLDPASPPRGAALARIRDAGHGPRLAPALVTWARLRRAAGGDAEPILALADLVDPDPHRRAARRWTTSEQVREGMASIPPAALLDPETCVTCARALQHVAGDAARASELVVRIAEMAPESARLQRLAAVHLIALGPDGEDRALAAATASVALEPENAGAWEVLSATHSRRGDAPRALLAARRALTLAPDWARARSRYVDAAYAAGETVRAARVALPLREERVRLRPTDARARGEVARALGSLGRYTEAASAFEEALRLDPGLAGVTGPLARSLLNDGRTAEAVVRARESRDANASNPFAHRFLGEALLAAGRVEEAVAAFDAAAERLEGTDDAFRARLEALRADARRRRSLSPAAALGATSSRDEAFSAAEVLSAAGDTEAAAEVAEGALARFGVPDDAIEGEPFRLRAAELSITAAVESARRGEGKAASGHRRRALAHLRSALTALDVPPGAPLPGPRLEVLVRWTGLASLGRVPEPNGFAALPEAERNAWTAFWRDVSATIDRPMEGDPSPAAPTLQRTFR